MQNALLGALERRGIPREEAMRDWKLIPNRISLVRIFLAPLPALFLIIGPDVTLWRWFATSTFVLLIATDGFDGWLARRYNWTSELGRVLDPIGDKLLIVLTLVAMVWAFWGTEFGLWFCVFVAIAIAREVILTIQIRAAHDMVTSPTLLGKAKTALQAVLIIAWLAPLDSVSWWWYVTVVLLGLAFAITIASWLEYDELFVDDYRRKRRTAKREYRHQQRAH